MAAMMPLVRGALGTSAPISSPANAMTMAAANPVVDTTKTVDESSLASGLAKYIRDAYTAARNNRNQVGNDNDLINALYAVRGQYDEVKRTAIKKMGGTDVYLRISANKVRAVAAALRDVYASSDRPWGIDSTPEPEMPTDANKEQLIDKILQQEIQEIVNAAQTSGQPMNLDPQMFYSRRRQLRDLLYQHEMADSQLALKRREDYMDDILTEGGFYKALWDFLLDIATFPYAVIKGPVIYNKNRIHWENGKAVVKNEPVMTWERRSPFDVFFAPWSQDAQQGYIIDRQRTTRQTLQSLIGLPSYDADAIREVLDRDQDQWRDWFSFTEQDRSDLERRKSDMDGNLGTDSVDRPFPMLEYHGPVSGDLLLEWGMPANQVPSPDKDLDITAWLIDDIVIGVRLNPHPMGAKPFYVDSFERVPGSIFGLGVPKMIEDVQDAGNATIRALVNNMAISSGPQVAINEGRLNSEDGVVSMFPWKVWPFTDDQTGTGSQVPITFFQPASNAGELLGVLKQFMEMADTFSSMPQYMQGNAQGMATVGRSASGLSMMMDAANRTLKQSITSIDQNVIVPILEDLNIYLSLLRPDIVDDGDINIVAKGATELAQREQLRMRRLQFLQVTQNPIDSQIVGVPGRAALIKEIARDLNLPVDQIVTGAGSTGGMPPNIPGQGAPGAPGAPGVPSAAPSAPGGGGGAMQAPGAPPAPGGPAPAQNQTPPQAAGPAAPAPQAP